MLILFRFPELDTFAPSDYSDNSEVFAPSDISNNEVFSVDSMENFAEESSDSFENEESCSRVLTPIKAQPLPTKLYSRPTSRSPVSPHLNPNEIVCSRLCRNKCHMFIKTLSEDVKCVIKSQFESVNYVKKNENLLAHLQTQKMLGLNCDNYSYCSQTLCIAAFCHVSGVSIYLANKVLRVFQSGHTMYIHGNKAVPRESAAHVNFLSWMIGFSDLHGQSDPVKLTTVLPAFLNKAELFKIYEAEASKPHLKRSTFYFLMKKKFGVNRNDKSLPNIRIRKGFTK